MICTSRQGAPTLRGLKELEMDIRALPKAELHCHLDGVLDPAMAREIRCADPTFPVDPAAPEAADPITDVESFFRRWDWIRPIEGQLKWFYPILAIHMERLKAQRVVYAEVMLASGELPRDPAQAVEEISAFREWADRQEDGRIQVEFLVAFGRNGPPEAVARLEDRILALHQAGLIVGVALAGPERGNPVQPFHSTFARLHEAGLRIEIHAGEWCGPESVWDALTYGYPDRIGHGVSLFQDPRLVEIFQERQIHVEMCPTSNLQTGSVSRLRDHPVGRARDLGLHFSVNTDDPGVFGCSVASEYALLAEEFGFAEDDLRCITAHALEARFQPQLRIAGGTAG
jgi:adenosine deaminase